ncbi:PTS ascorbate transporter subunit IIC [Candidatus Epulonipiscium viviparus]|uniref:PTS ascorbate transporter subunit IIC n=1 Tax=Candidatus Epulonipiscium viviparus TaxID=420336 RepID=UPI0027381019|nr:PTS ascorbate transporter subunit IIC [Candidatus Epulopiscium viviparus]
MSFLQNFIDFISEPSVLIGIIVLLGLIIQKKSATDIIKATLKAMVGFVIISAGAGIIVEALDPFGKMFEYGFNVTGVIPNNEVIISLALDKYGQATALVMCFGMLVNILIARFSRLKYIFLTGHHTLFMAGMITVILTESGMNGVQVLFVGAVALGLIMVLSPAICQPFMQKVTKTDQIALGHFSGAGYALAGLIGKLVGKGSKSTEEMNVPKSLSFLRDSVVSISLTMLVLYLVVAFVAGAEYVETELSAGKNFLVYAMIQALTFTAGFIVIQNGVRLVLNEIVPAFKGIATKLVPGAKPALDCPITFTYAPNAVILGFMCSFIGGIVSMFALGALNLAIIIPGVVPHFFTGATAGVFANATGGRRGVVVGSFINGILISFLPVALLPVLGGLGIQNSTFGDADFALYGIFLGNIQEFWGSWGITLVLFFAVAAIIGFSYIKRDASAVDSVADSASETTH